MGRNKEKSQKPREMVHRAQAQCAQSLHRLRLARHDVRSANDIEKLRRALHASVMLYWEQIKRFSSEQRINDRWESEPVVTVDEEALTLADLGDRRLTTETRVQPSFDPETNTERRQQESVPWRLEEQQALKVYDALDDCANALGFDARPERDARETGVRGDSKNPADDPEDIDHLNSEVQI